MKKIKKRKLSPKPQPEEINVIDLQITPIALPRTESFTQTSERYVKKTSNRKRQNPAKQSKIPQEPIET